MPGTLIFPETGCCAYEINENCRQWLNWLLVFPAIAGVVALDSTGFYRGRGGRHYRWRMLRSGSLALLKRTGFNAGVLFRRVSMAMLPAGVNAVILRSKNRVAGLESAACQYEEELLPPFFDIPLTQYVEMGNSTFARPGHQHGEFFKSIRRADISMSSLVRTCLRDMCNADVKLGDLI